MIKNTNKNKKISVNIFEIACVEMEKEEKQCLDFVFQIELEVNLF